MKRLTVGILAHVDAGKTTLSEGLLYVSGAIRKPGRVDHGDAFLDTYALERERGITIFSKQAVIPLDDMELLLLDTPGHVDFSAEMERTLQVLDYAILVISGTDGVQAHTRTLWQLLGRYNVPTFLFVNKMDLAGADRESVLSQLRETLSDGCIDFSLDRLELWEQAAVCDEALFARYTETGALSDEDLAEAVSRRSVFPCCFGSALKLEGVEAFLACFSTYTRPPVYPASFGARVYKISRDDKGARLTHLKVTGGSLEVKSTLPGGESLGKIEQIRIYSGTKYTQVQTAPAGTVCAVTGLTGTMPGDVFGIEEPAPAPLLEPVLTYRILLPGGQNVHDAFLRLKELEEEDPQLHILWQERLREIHDQLMGRVQLDVLKDLIRQRFAMEVEFSQGNILYKETIADTVEGVGHFEPLRHYAEVHLILSPLDRGSGLVFDSRCPEDELDRNWQRLILTHLYEKTHIGVLTGMPITDMRITLVSGKAHVKHTEGGDFRQATYRAVRNGLMQARCVLLEPWYSVTLEVPAENVGRAMSDLQQMSGVLEPSAAQGEVTMLTGSAPVACIADYAATVSAYTKGRGRLSLAFQGYDVCHDPERVIGEAAYDPAGDVENTPDSVFCYHGGAEIVPWDKVREHMHLPAALERRPEPGEQIPRVIRKAVTYSGTYEEDKELQRIFERTYGPAKGTFLPRREERIDSTEQMLAKTEWLDEYLLVDGYNVIFAWPELSAMAKESLDLARQSLIRLLTNYQGFTGKNVILVFDAYNVPGSESIEKHGGLYVVYTRQSEIADVYIEKITKLLGKELRGQYRIRVVTSDGLEQCIILAHGGLRISARIFAQEVEQVTGQIRDVLQKLQ